MDGRQPTPALPEVGFGSSDPDRGLEVRTCRCEIVARLLVKPAARYQGIRLRDAEALKTKNARSRASQAPLPWPWDGWASSSRPAPVAFTVLEFLRLV